eukprot:gb/GEZN01009042.1/.p1 GENE.gb/GEZN01009042.1/~~gb/GEZN01009042.1/.p1  ORF type:complete len:389 (-),score=53.49 gb/GEZN01009042.1/:156-1322(-)
MASFIIFALLILRQPGALGKVCGDTSGEGGVRIACACGDAVTTDTILQSSDPIVNTACNSSSVATGLWVSNRHTILDCAWNEIRSVLPPDQVPTGIYVGNSITGFFIDKPSANSIVRRCKINFFSDGIVIGFVETQDVTIVDNIITNSGNNGIRTSSRGTQILRNEIKHSRGAGLVISSTLNAISFNRITGSLYHGLWLEGSFNLVTGNKIFCSGLAGISSTGDQNVFSANLVLQAGSNGLQSSGNQNQILYNAAVGTPDQATAIRGNDNYLVLNLHVGQIFDQGIQFGGGEGNTQKNKLFLPIFGGTPENGPGVCPIEDLLYNHPELDFLGNSKNDINYYAELKDDEEEDWKRGYSRKTDVKDDSYPDFDSIKFPKSFLGRKDDQLY